MDDTKEVKQSTDPKDLGLEPAIFANGKGEDEFVVWVFQQVKYPNDAKEQGIQGRVVASIELSEEGTVPMQRSLGVYILLLMPRSSVS